jgi:hypothetical protein
MIVDMKNLIDLSELNLQNNFPKGEALEQKSSFNSINTKKK